MQRTLLSALLATAVACSSSTAPTSVAPGNYSSANPARPTAQTDVNSESAAEPGDDEWLLGIDLSPSQIGSISDSSSIDGGVVDTEDSHDHGAEFLGPLIWPDRPSLDADPVEHVAWLATVLLNSSAGQPFDNNLFEGLVASPLVAEFETAFAPSDDSRSVAHRAVLVDSWTDDATTTSTRVEAVAVFERTSGIGNVQLPGFEMVYVDVTLVLDPTSRWVAVELLVSS